MSNGVSFAHWADTIGKYRWVHEDGSTRTYNKLDYQWQAIYDAVTAECDMYYHYREITDPIYFTSEFLARVPMAWLKFKTEFELVTGQLDGTTISPDLFNQGFTREFSRSLTDSGNGYLSDSHAVYNGARTDTMSTSEDSSVDDKTRVINYQQGVQAYDSGMGGIGQLGNDYASGMQDTVSPSSGSMTGFTTTTIGKQDNSITHTQRSEDSSAQSEIIREKVERINFYDNLAFLRDRVDRLDMIKPFYSYFNDLFIDVCSYSGNW